MMDDAVGIFGLYVEPFVQKFVTNKQWIKAAATPAFGSPVVINPSSCSVMGEHFDPHSVAHLHALFASVTENAVSRRWVDLICTRR